MFVLVTVTGLSVGVTLAAAGATQADLSPKMALVGLTALFLLPLFALTLKRTNDLDYPVWTIWPVMAVCVADVSAMLLDWSFFDGPVMTLHAIAFGLACLWTVGVLGFVRGTPGPNRHGADPVQLRTTTG